MRISLGGQTEATAAREGAVARSTTLQGAKIAVICGGALIAYRRDDFDHIPDPGLWDLPGGVREAGETALACALRETREEFGIDISPEAVFHASTYTAPASGPLPAREVAFFAARVSQSLIGAIVYGSEGQGWRMMPVAEFGARADAVPGLREAVAALSEAIVGSPVLRRTDGDL